MKALLVAGARPNFMKIAPVLEALDERGVTTFLVHTGQHYDAQMSDVFFAELGIRAPDAHLGIGSGTHAEQTAHVMLALEPIVLAERPDVVIVVGDVNSTLGAALVGAKCGRLVAHVEAGLRSGDWSMPEEVNRAATDRVSDLLFAPSPDAVVNLRAEGHPESRIHLVGNVMIDTLLANLERAKARPILDDMGLRSGGYGLVTLHRPANVDEQGALDGILDAFDQIARDLPLVFPAHPRVSAELRRRKVGGGIIVMPPSGYLDFIALQAGAAVVLTDSGGVQEETTALGVPCLTLRDNTERPITVGEGTNVVVGRDPRRIVAVCREVLANPPVPRRPELWDGHAGGRIADVIASAPQRR
jgi:UDP-N-acetylglucosamine 2-epimerase (non-hydrolysing)